MSELVDVGPQTSPLEAIFGRRKRRIRASGAIRFVVGVVSVSKELVLRTAVSI